MAAPGLSAEDVQGGRGDKNGKSSGQKGNVSRASKLPLDTRAEDKREFKVL
ncbi:hypothetical protein WMY93_028871, partial [Mugilogobius chulae]